MRAVAETTTKLTHRAPRRARPIEYTPELAAEICARLMEGESLVRIGGDPAMPARRSIVRWLADPAKTEFHKQYQLARQIQAEVRVDEMFEILDDDSEDYVIMIDKKGREVLRPNHEHVQRTRLRIDTIKWFASKLAPKIYGERVVNEHDVTGELADMLRNASNRNTGLPEPIPDG